ncbi:MAG: histidine tRNA synthetase [Edafosvirus sp.]|uniref:histidine--tRNA ligase n=1 Tax=Edafosvirus sp. TaxID=2487765 RepID=A0A3G4ZTK1_9VIRU|nr:MAG: histidine tRNA synthetase [Edafosvirus sp.]
MDESKVIGSRLPTGMRYFDSKDIFIREHILTITKKCYEARGAQPIDTPVAELMETVKNLYGDAFNKEVYKLDDNKTILRYDLTVQFAEYIASKGITCFRRSQIGKVYRADDPQICKGRYCEFYQYDFDIVGDDNELMIYDFEVLDLMDDLLTKLIGRNFIIKINHRNILYKILENVGISNDKIQLVSSSLDKFDKKTWLEIQDELKKKEIDQSIIDKLNLIVIAINDIKDNYDMLEYLITTHDIPEITIKQIKTILQYIKTSNMSSFKLDPFLVRGLDYYTGIIFEAVYKDSSIMSSSIASGGRYDKMLEKFCHVGAIPAIGMSLGVERIVTILEKTGFVVPISISPQVYVASIGSINDITDMIGERIKLCCEFRRNGIRCMMSHASKPTMRSQFDDVFKNDIPYMIVIGKNEIIKNSLTIKDIKNNIQIEMTRDEGIKMILDKMK